MAVRIIQLAEIKNIVAGLDLRPAIEDGFAKYSSQRAVVPPVGELLLDHGEVHIKYGYIRQDAYYVIKVASGFYGNPALGLSFSNGMMLLFDQKTGEPVCILLDEGYLTDVRTAVAGCVVARYFAPQKVYRIGIVGTGTQAVLQLLYLQETVDCRDVLVWGRGKEHLALYQQRMTDRGYSVETTQDLSDILNTCNLVITTTPSTKPLLQVSDISRGVHITAVGADTPNKQELESALLARADLVVVDSISQCRVRGEVYRAVESGDFSDERLIELGAVIMGKTPGRTDDSEVTIADLTGVAVQDIKIAEAVYREYITQGESG